MKKDESPVIRVDEIAEEMQCSRDAAYRLIRDLNKELEAKGYYTIRGRLSRAYYRKRTGQYISEVTE